MGCACMLLGCLCSGPWTWLLQGPQHRERMPFPGEGGHTAQASLRHLLVVRQAGLLTEFILVWSRRRARACPQLDGTPRGLVSLE